VFLCFGKVEMLADKWQGKIMDKKIREKIGKEY